MAASSTLSEKIDKALQKLDLEIPATLDGDVIYILPLEGDRLYVGTTNNIARRTEEHLSGQGAAFTKKYRMVGSLPIRVYVLKNQFMEDNVTVALMCEFGYNFVRGGSYVTNKLSAAQQRHLRLQCAHTDGRCIKCGLQGHKSSSCRMRIPEEDKIAKKQQQKTPKPKKMVAVTMTLDSGETATKLFRRTGFMNGACGRCHRPGHNKASCYATFDGFTGERLPPRDK